MTVYYVFQGETYNQERAGGYVWSPQLNRSGGRNAGYTMMTAIRKDDFILHNSNGKIMSISLAKDDFYEAIKPPELSDAGTSVEWNDEGYRVDLDYFDFDVPVVATKYKKWLADHFIEGSVFSRAGTGKQQYMCHLADEHAIFLLGEAIKLQNDVAVLNNLKAALADIVGDKESEYDQVEMESVNEIVEDLPEGTIPD